MYTIDASVWTNGNSPAEPGHLESVALLDTLQHRAAIVIEPILLLAEFAGAISRTRDDPALAAEMAAAVLALPMIRWIELDLALGARATELAGRHRLRGADAVYAAVAQAHGCTLISLDREHLTRLGAVVRTITPAAALAELPGMMP